MEFIRQQLRESQHLFETGEKQQALNLAEQIHRDYPNNASAALTLAQYYEQQQEYSTAIPYYEEALRRLARDPLTSSEMLGLLHYGIAEGYQKWGQQKIFTRELCLRILYHLEQAWPVMMAQPHDKQEEQSLRKFVQKKLYDYDLMNRGNNNVTVLETADPESLPSRLVEPGTEFSLHDDKISEVDKTRAAELLRARLR